MDSRRKCISGERGTTLIEVVAAIAILSAVVAGLGAVYTLAIDQWEKAVLRIRLQQAGTFCVEEVVRSLQSASSIEENDNMVIARYVVPDLYIDSSITIRQAGGTLEKNNKTFFPVTGLEKRFQQTVAVKSFEIKAPVALDSLYWIRLVLTANGRDKTEDMEFTTGFYLRNAIVADATPGQGTAP